MNRIAIRRNLNKHAPTILTGVGIAGMWLMGGMIFKAAPTVRDKLDEAEEEKGEKLTVVEKAKISLPIMWPSLAVGSISTYSSISANRVHMRRNAALSSAYYISQRALKEYQEKVIESVGERKEQKIRDEVAKERLQKDPITDTNVIVTGNGNHLCYIVPFGIYFESDIEKVKQAVLNVNERMINGNEMYMSVNDFLHMLEIKPIGVGDNLGWNIENGQFSVSFSSALASDGRPCLTIDFDVVAI